jgi:hypothetical protein
MSENREPKPNGRVITLPFFIPATTVIARAGVPLPPAPGKDLVQYATSLNEKIVFKLRRDKVYWQCAEINCSS